MKVTPDILFDLEDLKFKFLLNPEGDVLSLVNWTIEKKETLFGKSKESLIALHIMKSEHINTKWLGVYREYLDLRLNQLKAWRKAFIRMKDDLKKFEYIITKVINVKSEGC